MVLRTVEEISRRKSSVRFGAHRSFSLESEAGTVQHQNMGGKVEPPAVYVKRTFTRIGNERISIRSRSTSCMSSQQLRGGYHRHRR